MVKNTYGTGCFMLMQTGRQPRRESPQSAHHGGLAARKSAPGICPRGQRLRRRSGHPVAARRPGSHPLRVRDVNDLAARFPTPAACIWSRPSPVSVPLTGIPTRAAPSWASRVVPRPLTLPGPCSRVIAYQVADVLEAMVADSGTSVTELRVDGGAAASDLLLQFQADVLGVVVQRPAVTETTALGAAYLAGLGVNLWRGIGRSCRPQAGRPDVRSAGCRRPSAKRD